jgi:hypothetical protein
MKLNYAEYLKRESAVWALCELLNALNIIPRKQTRFGPCRLFSDHEIQLYIQRLVQQAREQRCQITKINIRARLD